jgi:Uma2 family endonuclease
MDALRVQRAVSAEEYLRWERSSAVKHEYVRGSVRALAGASERHNRLMLRLAAALLPPSEAHRCRVVGPDMRLRVRDDLYYYPDVMVVCEEDPDPYEKTRPCLIVEVLSPSTREVDLGEKRLAYTGIETLRAYLVFDADGPWAVGHYRTDAGFEERIWEGGGSVSVPCAGVTLELEGLYGGLLPS